MVRSDSSVYLTRSADLHLHQLSTIALGINNNRNSTQKNVTYSIFLVIPAHYLAHPLVIIVTGHVKSLIEKRRMPFLLHREHVNEHVFLVDVLVVSWNFVTK